jgi:hypothetical protein
MKSKKAIKRLTRVEKLLAEVQSHYSAMEKPLGKLLSSAKASIEGIRDSIAKSIQAKAALPKPAKSKAKKPKKSKKARHADGKKKSMPAKAKSDEKPSVSKKRAAKRSASGKRKRSATVPTPDAGPLGFETAS